MKYFIDTEFLEGPQTIKTWWGKTKTTKPTIDLISIGIVDLNGREFYAISKDFNLYEAWNRYDLIEVGEPLNMYGDKYTQKVYWIRDNVLLPIYKELIGEENRKRRGIGITPLSMEMNYKDLKYLISVYGKSNIDIANGICGFIYGFDCGGSGMSAIEIATRYEMTDKKLLPTFYAYFADYDWVAFCWLFGKMVDLPKGFPKYCRDLKQMIDNEAELIAREIAPVNKPITHIDVKSALESIKQNPKYPKQTNEHNALADAKWNLELYNFLVVNVR